MDSVLTDEGAVADQFCIDLNDNVLTPGDTISYFFAAQNNVGVYSYFSRRGGVPDTYHWQSGYRCNHSR